MLHLVCSTRRFFRFTGSGGRKYHPHIYIKYGSRFAPSRIRAIQHSLAALTRLLEGTILSVGFHLLATRYIAKCVRTIVGCTDTTLSFCCASWHVGVALRRLFSRLIPLRICYSGRLCFTLSGLLSRWIFSQWFSVEENQGDSHSKENFTRMFNSYLISY